MKLSSRGTGINRQIKRYFVLRNRLLLCYRSEPQRAMNYALGNVVTVKGAGTEDSELSASLILDESASISLEGGGGGGGGSKDKHKSGGGKGGEGDKVKGKDKDKDKVAQLLVIKTEEKTFTLRLRGGKHALMEATFISQLERAIELVKTDAGETFKY